MIPRPVVTAWRTFAPWPQDWQVEQDLVISRVLVEIFNNEYLKGKVAFRGGTALHKLILPEALRYSDDIDLNRLEEGPAGPVIDNVNVRETLPQKPLTEIPFSVDSDYFKGSTLIKAFAREEMIGTKIRALYQRNKGRDLFDLFQLSKLELDWNQIVESYKKLNIGASRSDYEKNLKGKISNPEFLEDMIPLLPTDVVFDPKEAFEWFSNEIIPRM